MRDQGWDCCASGVLRGVDAGGGANPKPAQRFHKQVFLHWAVKKRLSVLAPQARGARTTGGQRKKAIVAVARHLAVDLWRVHTGRNTAAQLGLTI